MKKKVVKAGDGDTSESGKKALILYFPTEIKVKNRGIITLTFFNGFTHCCSETHGDDDASRHNHIKSICRNERLLAEKSEMELEYSETPKAKGAKRPITPGNSGGTRIKKKLIRSFSGNKTPANVIRGAPYICACLAWQRVRKFDIASYIVTSIHTENNGDGNRPPTRDAPTWLKGHSDGLPASRSTYREGASRVEELVSLYAKCELYPQKLMAGAVRWIVAWKKAAVWPSSRLPALALCVYCRCKPRTVTNSGSPRKPRVLCKKHLVCIITDTYAPKTQLLPNHCLISETQQLRLAGLEMYESSPHSITLFCTYSTSVEHHPHGTFTFYWLPASKQHRHRPGLPEESGNEKGDGFNGKRGNDRAGGTLKGRFRPSKEAPGRGTTTYGMTPGNCHIPTLPK